MTPAKSGAFSATPAPPVDVVLWGLGTGRRARALVREGLRVEVLAIDIDPTKPESAQAVLADCPHLLAASNRGDLRLVIGTSTDLSARFQQLSDLEPRPQMQVDLVAVGHAPAQAKGLATLVERLHLERNDVQRFAPRMRANLRDNLDILAQTQPINEIRGAAAGCPGFVLAAGPSAQLSLQWLAAARNLGPLIAVDTALPLCQQARLPVDVLASIDPHPGSASHLRHGTDGVGILAIQPYTAPAVVQSVSSRIFALPTGDQLCESAGKQLHVLCLPVAGTVLLYALQIAELLGCDPIVMVGADFAHVGHRTHAVGTATSKVVAPTGVVTHNRQGEVVPTSTALKRFCADIERFIANSPARHIAVDGGGAVIAGARPTSPQAAARWVRRAARERRPIALPTPALAAAHVVEKRRKVWDALIREFDGPR